MCSHAHLNIQQSNDPLTQLVKSKHFQMKLQRSKQRMIIKIYYQWMNTKPVDYENSKWLAKTFNKQESSLIKSNEAICSELLKPNRINGSQNLSLMKKNLSYPYALKQKLKKMTLKE